MCKRPRYKIKPSTNADLYSKYIMSACTESVNQNSKVKKLFALTLKAYFCK